ncbi:hypothetical protein USDA257_c11060 [Sinorhizobium fredii USDA 257]|uniref:Uncharacterized protein n=1 Tax=Sinorhizobium fredii (strain USDA 257) TaxID=1185652 RepID=I3X1E1_SINF2|nr:hypothetical protein USDA257_c11060 [Sinorhizobium fredii USDA 257]
MIARQADEEDRIFVSKGNRRSCRNPLPKSVVCDVYFE